MPAVREQHRATPVATPMPTPTQLRYRCDTGTGAELTCWSPSVTIGPRVYRGGDEGAEARECRGDSRECAIAIARRI